MFCWRLALTAFAMSTCACLLALAYEDDIEVNYADPDYANEIIEGEMPEPTPNAPPCSSTDLTKWDKIFSMLENSQMRENMLLHYADDIVKVEMGSLRGEILRFLAQYGGSCGVAVEAAGRRMAVQLEARLRESLERLRLTDQTSAAAAAAGNWNHLEATLQQLLSAARTQTSRLVKLETSCFGGAGAGTGANAKTAFQLGEGGGVGQREQEVMAVAEGGVLEVLQQTREELREVLRSGRQRYLPAGCEAALLFPMRSRRIFTSVVPDVPLSLSAFTVCLWVKPTAVANKTVLFSYGSRRNPYEIQLLLARTSALFTVGGEAHLVEAQGAVGSGSAASHWLHLCGSWSSQQGLASLWVGGRRATSTPGVAEGHVIPDGGSLQLGQERNGCCLQTASGGGAAGFQDGFDAKLAFAGKMTGVNMWDRVLTGAEISQLALEEGRGCEQRGGLVAWGVTEMLPHGGAQFVN